jgi:hypothetical protein
MCIAHIDIHEGVNNFILHALSICLGSLLADWAIWYKYMECPFSWNVMQNDNN